MLEYLKELLEELRKMIFEINLQNKNQKILALETAIEILEKLK